MSRIRQRTLNSVPIRIFRKTLAVLLLVGIPAYVFISTFQIEKVEVAGEKRYTQDQIIAQVIQTKLDHNSLYLYLKYQFFADVKMPFIEKIDVDMKNTHSVTIYVYEKMVAGCVEFMGEYLYFDKDGIVVESSSTKLEDIPMIKGLEFDKIILSEKLEVQKDELFDKIINLTQLIEKFGLGVDSVIFNKEYEVTVVCDKIKVLLGKRNNYDEVLSELKSILKEADGMDITIDMRDYTKGTDSIIATPNKQIE